MSDDDLDRILSHEDDIVPSSGFVSLVMDAVKRDAATPPPIPFPWRRAVPGFVAWALTLVAVVAAAFRWIEFPSAPAIARLLDAAASIGAGWIVLALLMSFVSVTLAMRFTGARE